MNTAGGCSSFGAFSMQYEIDLPQWAIDETEDGPSHIVDVESRMRTIIRFARLNVEHDTGGPFAAGVFESASGRVVSIGVNRVVPCNNSSAHAEIVAISLAQRRLKAFDLGADGQPRHQLVVNGRPCAMCFGAIPWSGVRSVVYAASGTQIEQLTGFDEGPIHPNWQQALEDRGIEVIGGVLEREACEALKAFRASGRAVYNGRQGT